MDNWSPLLAADATGVQLNFPVMVSPKLDGIRCLMVDGLAKSRALKPIANRHTRKCLELHADLLSDFDGELMVGDEFGSTTSGIATHLGTPDFTYHVFDIHSIQLGFQERFKILSTRILPQFCKLVHHEVIENQFDLDAYYEKMILKGLEGIIIRSLNGKYKFGRSTVKEGILFKLKPFEDSEARIIGFEELQHNENEQFKNELGYSARSTQQSGKIGGDTLGKFLVEGIEERHFGGVKFKVGTGRGLTLVLRQEIWNNREKYLGKLIKFKYQKIGSLEKPRIPIFLGFRDPSDLS